MEKNGPTANPLERNPTIVLHGKSLQLHSFKVQLQIFGSRSSSTKCILYTKWLCLGLLGWLGWLFLIKLSLKLSPSIYFKDSDMQCLLYEYITAKGRGRAGLYHSEADEHLISP